MTKDRAILHLLYSQVKPAEVRTQARWDAMIAQIKRTVR